MQPDETELEMTRRHVAAGERHIADQRRIIARLEAIGGDTVMAKQLLAEFETTLEEHRAHRDRLEASA